MSAPKGVRRTDAQEFEQLSMWVDARIKSELVALAQVTGKTQAQVIEAAIVAYSRVVREGADGGQDG